MALRDPQDTKERVIKDCKEAWEKNRGTQMPKAEVEKLEKQMDTEILPKIYDKKG